jgi:hypothetical protein
VTLFDNSFLSRRGIPLIPTDKVHVAGEVPKTKIVLIRVANASREWSACFSRASLGNKARGSPFVSKGLALATASRLLPDLALSLGVGAFAPRRSATT